MATWANATVYKLYIILRNYIIQRFFYNKGNKELHLHFTLITA